MSRSKRSQQRLKLASLLGGDGAQKVGSSLEVKGWIKTLRKSKNVCFISLNDGSCMDSLQVVIENTLPNYESISSLGLGCALHIRGELVASPGNQQSVELKAHEVLLLGGVDKDYPLQKKATSLEFLREKAHLRPRTNTFSAVFRVRHHLAYATHKFFHDKGFFYLNSPIITASDCEGAGAMFQLTTLNLKNPPKTPQGDIDYSKDFFARPTYLTVSGQLSGECFALALGDVYTFGPTFRAENSNTARHLAEFWMVEPEVAFADLEEIAQLAEDYLKYLIGWALEHCPKELEFFQKMYSPQLLETLQHVHQSTFEMVPYTQAVSILEEAQSKEKFEYEVKWGHDLQTEHERYLTEKHFKSPVIVTDYPKEIKAFYMKLNEDNKTVRAMDVLVPGIGEIMGGSQREENEEKLLQRIQEMGLNKEDYWWYMDLRRFGSVVHSGFGLGFERAIMYITGMTNIRDVIPFPRTPHHAEF